MSYRVLLIASLTLTMSTFAKTQSIDGECALQLTGSGRTSFFDFNTNSLRGGPL